ncbi:MAG TPA: hypothetical protein VGB87_22615, partial [Vicinamibacteria bacterium]
MLAPVPPPLAVARALALVLGTACSFPAPALAQAPPSPSAAGTAGPEAEIAHVTAPVVLDGQVLFRVRGTTTYPAEDRARMVAERIEDLARTPSVAVEAVQAVPGEGFVRVVAGDRFLVGVTEADARLEDLDGRLLARAWVERIQGAIRAYRQAREPQVLLRGAQRALGATVLLIAALLAFRWAFRRLEAGLGRRYEEKIQSVQIQSFEVLRAQRLRSAFRAVVRVLRAATAAVLIYLWLQFVLGSFAATRPLAARLLSLVLEPLSRLGSGLLAQLPDLAFLLVLY